MITDEWTTTRPQFAEFVPPSHSGRDLHFLSAMDRPPKRIPEPTSVPGDFYVENRCCAFCGVPQAVAPDLVEWTDDSKSPHCRWKKQPSSDEELQRAFAIFDGQELGCHRYAGIDPDIQRRIGAENCDYPLPLVEPSLPDDLPPKRGFWSRLLRKFGR